MQRHIEEGKKRDSAIVVGGLFALGEAAQFLLDNSWGLRISWTALMLPAIPLGADAANEIGAKYSYPSSCTVLPTTVRSIFMDLADQLGKEKFRWIIIVQGHGSPMHNRMLDQASDYFHDTYGGEMINLFRYIQPTVKDLRTSQEQKKDGQPEHATMTETSIMLALKPELVASDYKTATPYTGANMAELVKVAKAKDWPGYFGDPSLATASFGMRVYEQWLALGKEFISQILAGKDYRSLPRYADLYLDDPGDTNAMKPNSVLEEQHSSWLKKHSSKAMPH